MPHVLGVAAFEIRHPVVFCVGEKIEGTFHGRPSFADSVWRARDPTSASALRPSVRGVPRPIWADSAQVTMKVINLP